MEAMAGPGHRSEGGLSVLPWVELPSHSDPRPSSGAVAAPGVVRCVGPWHCFVAGQSVPMEGQRTRAGAAAGRTSGSRIAGHATCCCRVCRNLVCYKVSQAGRAGKGGVSRTKSRILVGVHLLLLPLETPARELKADLRRPRRLSASRCPTTSPQMAIGGTEAGGFSTQVRIRRRGHFCQSWSRHLLLSTRVVYIDSVAVYLKENKPNYTLQELPPASKGHPVHKSGYFPRFGYLTYLPATAFFIPAESGRRAVC
jgi:hypothetical protein